MLKPLKYLIIHPASFNMHAVKSGLKDLEFVRNIIPAEDSLPYRLNLNEYFNANILSECIQMHPGLSKFG